MSEEYDWKSDKPRQQKVEAHPICDLCNMIIWGPVKFLHGVMSLGGRRVNGQYHESCAKKVRK